MLQEHDQGSRRSSKPPLAGGKPGKLSNGGSSEAVDMKSIRRLFDQVRILDMLATFRTLCASCLADSGTAMIICASHRTDSGNVMLDQMDVDGSGTLDQSEVRF